MQPAGGGDGRGLARFQSVPTAWLEALLLSDDDIIIDSPKSTFNQHLPVTSTDFVDPNLVLLGPDSGFLRQNSSPVEFLSHVNNSDDYGIPANYDDHLSFPLNVTDVEFATQMDGLTNAHRSRNRVSRRKEKKNHYPSAYLDEVVQASKEYDSSHSRSHSRSKSRGYSRSRSRSLRLIVFLLKY
ncbi:hypothetical protein L1987_53561 [Smallanthus sonchifolius]|uniref:Uncharacterized protein n=1 Tax=Smallanthus sonchifolius TaxID=185202 RepID=A0ACB9EWL5_9ASTR|nr:hypothetical protein L1987_53561 [Smallanthus sonchifolius]